MATKTVTRKPTGSAKSKSGLSASYEADVSLNDEDPGIIRCAKSGWKMDRAEQGLIDAIGNEIFLYYE